ncbi:sialate O-acetylesterase [Calycomorphotria hydatis]|uniref:Carbohydrate acetyl esterase/feruloyl esterase n=1 Tax=Calycomorphotria hydatis TaxID=2528027 RepID=A0A517T7F1_9PLAN|nr:sialate O-acetylesterase [Calycomorphotria hydatis]QDT64305.1 Carbohydrate acetyl esterase/feruloyl esterase precursor [Calycomorphotria hydatis]
MNFLLKCCLLFVALTTFVSAEEEVTLPESKEQFHLFLLTGQSNMAGRGLEAEKHQMHNPRVLKLNKDLKWEVSSDPIHYDKPAIIGVGLATTFANDVAKANPNITIGLIPAACGGSSITHWEEGKYFSQTNSHPYDDAISRARVAMKDGVLKGILWHQGESDSSPGKDVVYKEKLQSLIKRFRDELDAQEVPIILGQLAQFGDRFNKNSMNIINTAQKEIAESDPLIGFASSDGLTGNPDMIHFNTKSLHEFGHRYAKLYLDIVKD